MNLCNLPPYQKGSKRRRFRTQEERDDEDYQAFCRKLPSAYSGKTVGIVYAHYRTAANSGTGCKPELSGLPLTREEHAEQHRIGQYNFMPREWWEEKVNQHLNMWKLKKQHGN